MPETLIRERRIRMENTAKSRMLKRIFGILLVVIFAGSYAFSVADVDKETNITEEVVYYEKTVAITFDDGPHSAYTALLLDGLKERNVPATFFLIGDKIEGNEALVMRMKEEGHLIGNHTYNHKELSKLSKTEIREEIEATSEAIRNITGETVRYIRPPFGSFSDRVLWECEMTPVFWSVDTMDWENQNIDAIVKNTLENVKGGDIILMHDVYYTSVVAALRIIDELKLRGYVFVTADELIIE